MLAEVKRRERAQMRRAEQELDAESHNTVAEHKERLRKAAAKSDRKASINQIEWLPDCVETPDDEQWLCDLCERAVAPCSSMHPRSSTSIEDDIQDALAICTECYTESCRVKEAGTQVDGKTAATAQAFIGDIVHALAKDVRPAQASQQILNMLSEGKVTKAGVHKVKNRNLVRLSAIAAVFVIEQLSGGAISLDHSGGVGLRADDICTGGLRTLLLIRAPSGSRLFVNRSVFEY